MLSASERPRRTEATRLYTLAEINGIQGIFRSDDAGASWIRINDDQHQFATTGSTITGDPSGVRRVYIGANGRGIIQGDSHGPNGGCTVTRLSMRTPYGTTSKSFAWTTTEMRILPRCRSRSSSSVPQA